MIRQMKLVGGLLLASLMAACGGGGGSPGATPGGSTPNPNPPAAVELFASNSTLSSAPNSSVTFTVVVKDANNQAVPSQTVTFSASSGNLQGALPAPKTGANGEAITTVSLTPGGDPSVRDITVTATAGGVSKSIVVPVAGTSATVTGDSSLLLAGVSTYTVRATDSSGNPVPNAKLTASSALGNNLNPSSLTTDAQGIATFIYTANKAGLDTILVSGLGITARTNVSVSADDFRFESPSAGSTVAVGANQTVTVRYLNNGVGVAGRQVTFSSTRGAVNPTSAVTDANGRASTTLSSSTSGPANVIAQITGAQSSLPVNFVATTPANIVLQANPGSLPPNLNGSTTSQATLLATVRDAAGNPVAGRVVNFTAEIDGSNGTITPGSGTTDANGQAVAQFIPGGLTTASNGVVIRAAVQGTDIVNKASLTVNGQALFISIATGNVISNVDPTTYQKEFSVYVTDAQGAPAANQRVNLSVFPDFYLKGSLVRDTELDLWVYDTSTGGPNSCLNEDTDRNGILNVGEDRNGDGKLSPGLPVVVGPASVVTSPTGFATFTLQYGENYAPWVGTTITARASVGGTESVQNQSYFLQALASDMSSETPPAGVVSPFGTGACTSPN